MNEDINEKKKGLLGRITEALFTEPGQNPSDVDSLALITKEIDDMDWNVLIEEMRESIQQEGNSLRKFLGLVESLEDVIPDEDKRYRTAYKALVSTVGKNRNDLLSDTQRQYTELKSQKQLFTRTVSDWRQKLRSFSEQSKDLRRDINVLQEKIRSLEKQERVLIEKADTSERQIRAAEVKFGELIREVEKDISDLSSRIMQHLPKE